MRPDKLTQPSSFYLRTPGDVAYPLTTEEVLVSPGQRVAKGDKIAVLRTATGKFIRLKAPRDAHVGEHIMPSGTQIIEQGFFVQMHAVEAAQENGVTTGTKPAPEAQKPEPDAGPPKAGLKKDAALAFVLPVVCMLPTVILAEVAFPDFFEDTIWLRWLMILAGVLGGILWASAWASAPAGARNVLATVATVAVGLIALPLLFPLDLLEADFSWVPVPGDIFKPKVAGVVINDLAAYSTGNTPSPSYDLVQDFGRWLND